MKTKTPRPGQWIEITQRLCGKLQPSIQVGMRYAVAAVEHTKAGDCVVVTNTDKSPRRINSARFRWEVLTEQQAFERCEKDLDRAANDKMCAELPQADLVQIAFVPMIYHYIAWQYAWLAVNQARDIRVSELKKATRAVRELQREYDRLKSQHLTEADCEVIATESSRFLEECAYNFTILYWSMNGYLKKVYHDVSHQEIRTNALIAMLLLRIADAHEEAWSKVVQDKTGRKMGNRLRPAARMLYGILIAFAGVDKDFDFASKEVMDNVNVIINKIKAAEFEVNVTMT